MNAVVTITIGDYHKRMAEITHPLMKAYAQKIGAEFIVIDKAEGMPHYAKFQINKLLKNYDRLIYIDTDILIRNDSPDIFQLVPEDSIGLFDEGRYLDRTSFYGFMQQNSYDPNYWDKKYYNTGVMVVSKCHANIFLKPDVEQNHFFEQSYINLLLTMMKPKIYGLQYKWNRMYALDKITGEERHDSYFMHYAGIENVMSRSELLELMKKDIEVWRKASPEYKFQKNICVIVSGGIGDQVASEPVLRYIHNTLYKGDNVIAISDFPEIFTHLPFKVYKKGEKIENMKGFYEILTLRSPDHISWEYMSQPLIHPTDFASLQAIRMTLPLEARTIKQVPDLKAIVSTVEKTGWLLQHTKAIVLHPGKGWPSKTFPADIWQSYIDILEENEYDVMLIGKSMNEEQGVVEPLRCKINLIDKLDYNELVGLISMAKVLISNDSSPIHIAGAFDNHIGVIATCKRPEHILPYRHGTPFYKATALEEYKLYNTFNNQNSQVDGATIDKCDEETIRKCCPSPQKILEFVDSCK